MYECESWTTKKVECRRIDAFDLWSWRRLFRVPWIKRRSSQPILKETSPEHSLEGLILELKLQYFGHLMWRSDSFEKALLARKYWRQEEKGMTEDEMVGWHHRLNGHGFEQTLGVGDDSEAWCAAVHVVAKQRMWLSDWSEVKEKQRNYHREGNYQRNHTGKLFRTECHVSLGWIVY